MVFGPFISLLALCSELEKDNRDLQVGSADGRVITMPLSACSQTTASGRVHKWSAMWVNIHFKDRSVLGLLQGEELASGDAVCAQLNLFDETGEGCTAMHSRHEVLNVDEDCSE